MLASFEATPTPIKSASILFIFKKLSSPADIALSLILTCLLLIFHQLMTINAIFIYCLIPLFAGFSNVYAKKYLELSKALL